jgi:acetoin utilization deacetylase AcuC-like enzyme/GNAT superfamily N-acetyltransferase
MQIKPESVCCSVKVSSLHQVALVVNEHHEIHHVHDRGYVETPVRINSILAAIEPSGIFSRCRSNHYSEKYITAVHDPSLFNFIKKTGEMTPDGQSVYPYVFPIRNRQRPPRERSALAGYYCIDTFTPLNRNAYRAARRGVDCVLTAASEIIAGRRLAYALLRPPGHHAERQVFGGFCYFNNNAVAAQFLSRYGRVAILDVDYHHGNGQQDIFYRRADVLTVSIHGHPRFAYPYFTGFEDEKGEEEGEGFNMNIPLPEAVEGPRYLQALQKGLLRIEAFRPQFLVVALGLDTARGDPTGTWGLRGKDFEGIGGMIGQMGLPTLVVQEGGYRNRTLGRNALSFFKGLAESSINPTGIRPSSKGDMSGFAWRYELRPEDPERIRRLVELTGFFNPGEIDIAEELPRERLSKGDASGYFFVIAEHYSRMVGYTCYGPIAGSAESYDLYWIAVHPDFQRRGLGRLLIRETEGLIKKAGGGRIYVDTSERAQYASTRMFYESCGYQLEAILKDFYAPGDGKCIFCKILK